MFNTKLVSIKEVKLVRGELCLVVSEVQIIGVSPKVLIVKELETEYAIPLPKEFTRKDRRIRK